LRLGTGENTLNGEQALAYSRIREPSECPGKGKERLRPRLLDLEPGDAQQEVINGIKDRLTSITRIPYNFIHGPFIGLGRTPKAFVSDMGFFTMPQLVLAAGIRRDRRHQRPLRTSKKEAANAGSARKGSIEVPQSVRRAAVHHA